MKHWHRCDRWTKKGFRCPFRLLELEEERDSEDVEEPSKKRHAAAAEAEALVSSKVVVPRQISIGLAQDVLQDPVGAGYVDAVSTQTVPPFESPVEVLAPGRGTPYAPDRRSVPNKVVKTVKAPDPVRVKPTPEPEAKPVSRKGGSSAARGVNPRFIEQKLVDVLVEATTPAPAQVKPKPARVGAPKSRQSATTDLGLVQAQEDAGAASAAASKRADLTHAYLIEAAMVAAMAYGVTESVKAFRARTAQGFPDSRRIVKPKPILYAPRRGGGSSGDIPTRSGVLRNLSAGLATKDRP